MRKSIKLVLGVTLLEIMLVLAIAAMIIVMSVRYYQSATNSQQANAMLQTIQGIQAAADGILLGGGTYASVTSAAVGALMPNNTIGNTPWGTKIVIASTTTGYKLTLTSTPTAVCTSIITKLKSNPKYIVPAGCATITYDNTK